MKALFFLCEKELELKDIPVPIPDEKQYLLEIKATGICGSDFEGYLGKTGRRIAPMIMGHEASAVIVKSPKGGKLEEGTRVVVFPKTFCGKCDLCKKGFINLCPNGEFLGVMNNNGTMTEYIIANEGNLFPINSLEISFHEAAMTEPLAVAYHAVYHLSDYELDQSKYFLVLGAGTIGLLVAALLKARGAKYVIISDLSDYRLDVAKKLKANFTINPAKENIIEAVRKITSGKMCDVSFEAVGIETTAKDSLEVLHPRGKAIWIGNAQKFISINMQEIVTTELTISGNYIYDLVSFQKSLEILEKKTINVSPLITNVYPLSEGIKAFKDLETNYDGKIIKSLLINEEK